MNIGRKIKSFRVEKGYTQIDMASKLDVSDNTYRNIENNINSPSVNILEKIANILKISFLDLLMNNENDSKIKNRSKRCTEFCAFMYVPEKAIIKYENLLREKKEHLSLLKYKIDQLENTISLLNSDKT